MHVQHTPVVASAPLAAVAPSSVGAMLVAIGSARTVRLGAYILENRRLEDALAAAAARGASVAVVLEGAPAADPPAPSPGSMRPR